jgi:hypothetical protein
MTRRQCPRCGVDMTSRRPDAVVCSSACSQAMLRRKWRAARKKAGRDEKYEHELRVIKLQTRALGALIDKQLQQR